MSLRFTLGGTLCLGVLLAVRLVAWPLVRISLPAPAPGRQARAPHSLQVPIDSLAAATVARDPFRLTRRPADVAYDPLLLAEQLAPPAPKPALQLAGIVWEGGRDPTAVVEGLPSVDGVRVVRVGDLVAGLRIRSITVDAVRIAGMDTTWVLKLREPWR